MVITARIADILVGKPEGLSIEELANLSGLDAGKLGRILRMLATKHCFQEGRAKFLHSDLKFVPTQHILQ